MTIVSRQGQSRSKLWTPGRTKSFKKRRMEESFQFGWTQEEIEQENKEANSLYPGSLNMKKLATLLRVIIVEDDDYDGNYTQLLDSDFEKESERTEQLHNRQLCPTSTTPSSDNTTQQDPIPSTSNAIKCLNIIEKQMLNEVRTRWIHPGPCNCQEDQSKERSKCDLSCPNRLNLFECPISCGRTCKNSPFERNQFQNALALVHFQGKGLCVITRRSIEAGSFIGHFKGEVVRKNRNPNGPNSKFAVNFIGSGENELVVDATRIGDVVRFMAHDHEPNCEIFPYLSKGGRLRLVVIAIKNIEINEELTWFYGKDPSCLGVSVCHCPRRHCPDWDRRNIDNPQQPISNQIEHQSILSPGSLDISSNEKDSSSSPENDSFIAASDKGGEPDKNNEIIPQENSPSTENENASDVFCNNRSEPNNDNELPLPLSQENLQNDCIQLKNNALSVPKFDPLLEQQLKKKYEENRKYFEERQRDFKRSKSSSAVPISKTLGNDDLITTAESLFIASITGLQKIPNESTTNFDQTQQQQFVRMQADNNEPVITDEDCHDDNSEKDTSANSQTLPPEQTFINPPIQRKSISLAKSKVGEMSQKITIKGGVITRAKKATEKVNVKSVKLKRKLSPQPCSSHQAYKSRLRSIKSPRPNPTTPPSSLPATNITTPNKRTRSSSVTIDACQPPSKRSRGRPQREYELKCEGGTRFCPKNGIHKWQANWKRHMQSHHWKTKEFVCQLNNENGKKCGKRFATKKTLAEHEPTHLDRSKRKMWICSECSTAFVRKELCKVHINQRCAGGKIVVYNPFNRKGKDSGTERYQRPSRMNRGNNLSVQGKIRNKRKELEKLEKTEWEMIQNLTDEDSNEEFVSDSDYNDDDDDDDSSD